MGKKGHFMKNLKILLWSLALLLVLAGNAAALTITTYTDKNAWIAAVGGLYKMETFTDNILHDPGLTVKASPQGHITLEKWHNTLNTDSNNSFTVWQFDPKITAFGGTWNLAGGGGSGNYLVVTLEELATVAGYLGSGYTNDFWGFVCDQPFSEVKLTGGSADNQQVYDLDDMVYAPGAPLPGAVYLLGTGLLAIFLHRKS